MFHHIQNSYIKLFYIILWLFVDGCQPKVNDAPHLEHQEDVATFTKKRPRLGLVYA